MPPALSSPGFLVALAVLLANDLWWKAAYHNGLTGKLSDVAGLFVVVVLATAFRPASGGLIALSAAVAFTLWKSPLSQPLIDGWNALAPYRIARVVDYSDLLALAVIPVARRQAGRARPLAPKLFRRPIVALALLAILGTSKAPPTTYPYQAVEQVPFQTSPLIYDVALTEAAVLERLRGAAFTVEKAALPTDVVILSGFTCQGATPDGRRVASALLAVQQAGDGSVLIIRRVGLCHRTPPWDRESAASMFEAEVLARIGGGTRRP